MPNRIPKFTPPLSILLDDIGLSNKQASKLLKVSERTIQRWLKNDSAPWSIRLALFWISRWGESTIDANTTNRIRIYAGLARSQKDHIKNLEEKMHFLENKIIYLESAKMNMAIPIQNYQYTPAVNFYSYKIASNDLNY